MIAHSFRGAVFGPAQALHGATFVVDAAFIAETLDATASWSTSAARIDVLKAVLKPLNYKNLDDVPEFKGVNTTTEFLTNYIFDQLAHHAREGDLGRAGRELNAIRVTIGESHVARAWYEAPLVVKRVRVRGAGRSRDADRRLCLRPPHDRRTARARLAGRCDRSRRRLSAPERGREGARRAKSWPACRRSCPIVIDGLAFGVLPEAAHELRERTSADRAGASSAGAGNGAVARRRGSASRPASARRLRRRAASSSPARRPRSCCRTTTACRPDIITVARPGTDRGEAAKGSSDGIVRLLVGRLGRAAQGLSTC